MIFSPLPLGATPTKLNQNIHCYDVLEETASNRPGPGSSPGTTPGSGPGAAGGPGTAPGGSAGPKGRPGTTPEGGPGVGAGTNYVGVKPKRKFIRGLKCYCCVSCQLSAALLNTDES